MSCSDLINVGYRDGLGNPLVGVYEGVIGGVASFKYYDANSGGLYTGQVYTVGGGGCGSGVVISGGTNIITSGTVSFANSNGVSFGLQTNGIMTASINATAGGLTNINISAGTASNNLSALTFNNSNGVSFGLNGSVITATVGTNYQSQGAYLTTAMLSNAGSNFVGLNSALTGNGISATINSSGISINAPAYLTTAQPVGPYLTTAMLSNAVTLSNINISGGTTSSNISALQFSNSNGVSFGFDGTMITATVATNYQSTGAYLTTAMLSNAGSSFVQATAAFAGTNASGTIASNGISISVASPDNGVAIKGSGAQTQNTGTIEFANSNGITFGLSNNGTMTASHNGLTTAMASDAGSRFVNTSAGLNLTNVSATFNSNSISLSVANPVTTNGLLSAINISGGTASNNVTALTFSNSNGVSFGLNGSVMTATVKTDYLTTAMASDAGSLFVNTNAALNLTNVSATFNSNNISISVNSQTAQTQSNVQGISAGTQVGRTGDIVFSNSNGISFGMSNSSVITASYTVPSTVGLISAINISGGTTSNNLSALTLSNSNGISFGLNGSVITASHNALTTAMASDASTQFIQANAGFAGTNASGTIASNGISISVNAGGIALKGSGAQSQSTGTVEFANSNGITFGLSNNGTMTASHNGLTNINISAGTTSNNLSALTFNNSNGVSFGLNNSVVTGSFGLIVSGGNGIQTTASSLTFVNSNGISFGVNGNNITGSVQTSHYLGGYAVGNTTQSTSGTMNINTVSFRGEGVASVGISNGSVIISVPSGGGGITNINVSGGTTSQNLSNLVFSNSNGVSFGLDGSTITASCDANVTYKGFNPYPNIVQAYVAQGAGTLHIQPMPAAPNFTFDRVVMGLQYSNASNSSNSCTVSLSFGIYSLNASTLSLIGSNSTSFNITNSGTVGSYSLYAGPRLITLGMSSSLSAGDYYMGIWSRTTTGGGAGMSINQIGASQLNTNFSGMIGSANNASYGSKLGYGVYSVSFSTAMPTAISLTQIINGTASAVQRPPWYSFAHTTF